MLKKIILITCFSIFSSILFAQKSNIEITLGTFNDKGFPSFLAENGRFTYATTFYRTKYGIDYRHSIKNNFGFVMGYNFNYSYLQVNLLSRNPAPYYSGTKVYVHSIPVQLDYRKDLKFRLINTINLRIGGGIDLFNTFRTVFGTYQYRMIESISFRDGLFYTLIPPKNPIPFLQVNIGLSEKLSEKSQIRFSAGIKQQFSDFTHELYYYEKNDVEEPIIITQTISRKVTYYTFDLAYIYSF